MISDNIAQAIDLCIGRNIPFAVYAYPNDDETRFIAALKCGEGLSDELNCDGFVIGFFLPDENPIIRIPKQFTAEDVIDRYRSEKSKSKLPEAEIWPIYSSTRYINYLAEFKEIVASLKKNGGKTVLSRVIDITSRKNIAAVANEYFLRLKQTFRYLYFTPTTGLWIGATPETLLSYDYVSHNIATMALAGTRDAGEEVWDEKNREEHEYVVKHIESVFNQFGITAIKDELTICRFGNLEHLCSRFKAVADINPEEFLKKLSPTPAVCGYPLVRAIDQILRYELHSRHCYGGWIGVKDNTHLSTYVNLRCALIGPGGDKSRWRYNIYAGGGLVRSSVCADEWHEGARKIQPLYESIIDDSESTKNTSWVSIWECGFN